MRLRNKIILLIGLLFLSAIIFANRDPTRPPDAYLNRESQSTTNTKSLTLNAIVISKSRRVAIIDGKTVKVGDTIQNKKVIKIESDHVYLEDGNLQIDLPLFSQDVINTKGK